MDVDHVDRDITWATVWLRQSYSHKRMGGYLHIIVVIPERLSNVGCSLGLSYLIVETILADNMTYLNVAVVQACLPYLLHEVVPIVNDWAP